MAVFWTAIIVYALISPPSDTPRFPWLEAPGVDKVIHAVLFFIEAMAVQRLLNLKSMTFAFTIVLLWCALLGGGLELVQYHFVDGRNGDWWDLLADIFGAFVGLFFAWRIKK